MEKRIATTAIASANTIEIKVTYDKGGYNPFNGRNEGRGIYLHISPITVTSHGNYEEISYIAFTGVKYFLKELGRKSQKQLEIIENKLEPQFEEIAKMFEKNDRQGILNLLMEVLA